MRNWPDLPYPDWRDTAQTLQLWTQIVGKVRLALTPWLNHGWQVPLYVSARGLTTSPIAVDGELLEIEFDFLAHRLRCITSRGEERTLLLEPRTVADFYEGVMGTLREMGVDVAIHTRPNEIADPIPFPRDHQHASYDPEAVARFHRVLVAIDPVFKRFRTAFLGKASPVHFFWGSFDLAVTRFSGRPAPPHPGGIPHLPDAVTREAYSHEVSSAGFWPGSDASPAPAFYSYAYPIPDGFRDRPVRPTAAFFYEPLGEFILPYEAVRTAADPESALMEFLQSTYDAAADAGRWDRPSLECAVGAIGTPRSVK